MSGNGGNRIGFVPELGLVFAITSSRYDDRTLPPYTARLLNDLVAAAAR
jgi:hypothetical protein